VKAANISLVCYLVLCQKDFHVWNEKNVLRFVHEIHIEHQEKGEGRRENKPINQFFQETKEKLENISLIFSSCNPFPS